MESLGDDKSVNKNIAIGPNIFVTMKKGDVKTMYKVGSMLGEGAFGAVYQVTHK